MARDIWSRINMLQGRQVEPRPLALGLVLFLLFLLLLLFFVHFVNCFLQVVLQLGLRLDFALKLQSSVLVLPAHILDHLLELIDHSHVPLVLLILRFHLLRSLVDERITALAGSRWRKTRRSIPIRWCALHAPALGVLLAALLLFALLVRFHLVSILNKCLDVNLLFVLLLLFDYVLEVLHLC